MEIKEIKIDGTIIKFFDDYIEEDTTIFKKLLGTVLQKALEN